MAKTRRKKKPAVAQRQSLAAKRERAAQHPLPTANARIIRDLMLANRVKGSYKDYVIIAGRRLMDWRGSYDMLAEDGKTVGVEGMALIHKSKLAAMVGEETARLFWRPGIGRVGRAAHEQATST